MGGVDWWTWDGRGWIGGHGMGGGGLVDMGWEGED